MAANIAKTEGFMREAAGQGAQVILPSELFQGPISARSRTRWFATAYPSPSIPACWRWPLAAELGVVIPISIFERDGPHYYNSLVMADADGELLGVYRKSHIPDGPGYQEKYYFRPGDTGFQVWDTQHRRDRRRHLLGPVVPRMRARHGPDGRRGAVLSDRHRLRALRPQRSTRTSRGGARCRATRSPMYPGGRRQPHRPGGKRRGDAAFYGHSFIADHTGELVEASARRKACSFTDSTCRSKPTGPIGASSATAAPTSMPRAYDATVTALHSTMGVMCALACFHGGDDPLGGFGRVVPVFVSLRSATLRALLIGVRK